MGVPIKEDSHGKSRLEGEKAFSACNYIHNKLHVHICAWWLEFNQVIQQIWNVSKLRARLWGHKSRESLYAHLTQKCNQLFSDKFQPWIVSTLNKWTVSNFAKQLTVEFIMQTLN